MARQRDDAAITEYVRAKGPLRLRRLGLSGCRHQQISCLYSEEIRLAAYGIRPVPLAHWSDLSVVYCQDCGASNAATSSACRICAHQLDRTRGVTPCTNCAEPLGEGALFCSACGSPVPVLTTVGARGSVLRQVAMAGRSGDGLPDNSVTPGGYEGASDGGATSGDDSRTFDASTLISEDDLPAWLRQAVQLEEAETAEREERQAAEQRAAVHAARPAAQPWEAAQFKSELIPATEAQRPAGHEEAGAPHLEAPPVDVARADVETTDAVSEPSQKTSRRRRRPKVARVPRDTKSKAPAKPKRTAPRTMSWSGHSDKVVLAVSLTLILFALLLLAPGLFG